MRPEEHKALKPRGLASAPKFLENSQNKFLANEEENAYVQLEVFGDPAPSIKGDIELSELERFKFWTDGERNLVFLGITKCGKADEGNYKCLLTNRFGKREHKFKLFVSRSFQKKGPPQREVPLYWTDVPRSKFIKQGSTDQVTFTAKLTDPEKTAKWMFKDRICGNGDKYQISQGGGSYTLVIRDPVPEDTGCYKCVLHNLEEFFCETYLDVQLPDPEYYFLKPLPRHQTGYLGRSLRLSCLCAEDAQTSWLREGEEVEEEEERVVISRVEGESVLEISRLEESDAGQFSCKIVKFGKEGEDLTACRLNVIDFPHKFVKTLPDTIDLTEKDMFVLKVTTQENFATVRWFKDGEEIKNVRKRSQRMKTISTDCQHILAIEKVLVSDAGSFTAATNTESTSCLLTVADYPYHIKHKLTEVTNVTEDAKLELEVTVDDENAAVTWYHDDVEIIPEKSRLARVQIKADGLKRILLMKKTVAEDGGRITAKTNVDSSTTNLVVKCHNSFVSRLCETAECSEHCRMEFIVKVRDVMAPVTFYLDKMKIDEDDERFSQSHLEKGEHRLVITKVRKGDEGVLSCKTPTNRGNETTECKCIFNVTEGESPPIIGKVDPVKAVAILHSYSDRMNSYIQKEACKIIVPYKIEGTRISDLDILVLKDEEEVEFDNEILMNVQKDKIIIHIVNPVRSNTGLYKVILTNEQGSCEVSVPLEVLDIPSPPLSVTVTQVRKDSVVLTWKPPADDGGTPIKHFIVELCDITTNNLWTSVAMTESGDCLEQEVLHLREGHKYSFRVAAANRIGQSDPTDLAVDVVTKDPWSPPTQCGRPQVLDWTPTFVDLSWTGPASDGGAEIESFVLEMKETTMRDWAENCVIKVEDVECEGEVYRGRCENLEEEYQYRFRVLALNKAGRSQPSSSSECVVAMHKNISPFLKGEGIQDVKMKEGKPLRFDVWVGGEPTPMIEWFKDDVKITNDDTTSLSVYTKSSSAYTLKNAVLSIPRAVEILHAGVYKLRLRNESGVFESAATVDIDGPLENKKKKEEEAKQKQLEEERARKEAEEEEMNAKNLLESKLDGKEEDRDSGLKIGDESAGSDTEYTEGSEYSYYEDDESEEINEIQTVQTEQDGVVVELKDATKDTEEDEVTNDQIKDDGAMVDLNDGIKDDIQDTDETVVSSNEKEEEEFEESEEVTNISGDVVGDNITSTEDCQVTSKYETESDSPKLETDVLPDSLYDASQDTLESDDASNDAESEVLFETKEILGDNNNSNETTNDMSSSSNASTGITYGDSPELMINREREEFVETEFEESFELEKSDEENEEDIAILIEECRVEVESSPTLVFNKEEYLTLMYENLDKKLETAGFTKSSLSNDLSVDEGDQCLLNLLDQMKREDQDFKVWERDDFSFLRWYVTRQMETLHGKVDNLKFVEAITGDFQSYIDKMSQDGVPIDRIFIQATATIFNKDIILIPVDGETDFEVVVGGLNNGKSKGNPLYFGHIRKTENCPDIFVSVMPEKIDKSRISSILAGELTFVDKIIKENTEQDNEKNDNSAEDNPSGFIPGINQWKRMDSFTGSSSNVDVMINDIISGDNLNQLFSKLDDDDDDDDDIDEDSDSLSECNTVASVETIRLSDADDGDDGDIGQSGDIEEVDDCDDWEYDDQTGYWLKKQDAGVDAGDDSLEQHETEVTEAVDEVKAAEQNVSLEQHETEARESTEDQREEDTEEEYSPHESEDAAEAESDDPNLEQKTELFDHEQSETTTEVVDADEITEQADLDNSDNNNDDDCDGWSYDEQSGYWVENSAKEVLVAEIEEPLEQVDDKTEKVSEVEDLGHSDANIEKSDDDTEMEQEGDLIQRYEENEDCDVGIENNRNFFQKSVLTEFDNSDETEPSYEDEVAVNNQINTSEKVVCDMKSQDPKIMRKIKISVSVSDNDQVKESDLLQECDPVSVERAETKEVSEAAENAENHLGGAREDEPESDKELPSNNNTEPEPVNTQTDPCDTHERSEVKLRSRGPIRKYSQKKTASYRWSGAEMVQIDGPLSQSILSSSTETLEESPARPDPLQTTRINIGYKKASSAMEKKLSGLGFTRSDTLELNKDGDNCLKALLDQMSQPNQDFKVWEKDDFPFLRWYIAKQLEIQVSAGRSESYVRCDAKELENYITHIQKDESYVNNDYLYSVSKVFNKDIVVIDSGCSEADVSYFRGGEGEAGGKGEPLYLAHLRLEEAGQDYYQSILPTQQFSLTSFLQTNKLSS